MQKKIIASDKSRFNLSILECKYIRIARDGYANEF